MGNFGNQFLNLTDVLMVSMLGTEALAAVGFSAGMFSFVLIFCIGLVSGVGVTAANSLGERGMQHIGRILKNGFWISLTAAAVIFLVLCIFIVNIEWFGQAEVVNLLARPYLFAIGLSIFPFAILQNFKQVSEAMGNSRTPMVIILIGGLINVFLNYLLIFGKWGAPQMGVLGSAIATLIARILMVAFAYAALKLRDEYRALRLSLKVKDKEHSFKKDILRVGVPGGVQYLFEVSLFACGTMMMGWLGVVEQAAHQIVLNFASLSFMIPLGLANASGLRVGFFKGRHDLEKAREVGRLSLISLLILMLGIGFLFLALRGALPHIFSKDPRVLILAAELMIIVAAFQVFDGTQTLGVSILRGIQDVKVPTLIILGSYGVGIFICYYLGFKTPLRHQGIWIGLALGLFFTSVLLNSRFFWLVRRQKTRRQL